jgi:DNA-binding MarR family transcriptional regulator
VAYSIEGLDPERSALLAELFELNSQVHDRAMGLVGPMPMPPDLTMQQVRVLGQIVKKPGIAGHELGELMQISAPTASGLIDRLVEKGLVTRFDDPDDRRVRRLRPTADGIDVIRQMDSMFGRALGVTIKLLTLDDLKVLREGSLLMLRAMDRAAALQPPEE